MLRRRVFSKLKRESISSAFTNDILTLVLFAVSLLDKSYRFIFYLLSIRLFSLIEANDIIIRKSLL